MHLDEIDVKNDLKSPMIFDNITKRILAEITSTPKSAIEISKSTNIPLTTAYRRLHSLVEQKLVRISGIIIEGKKNFLYESKIKTV